MAILKKIIICILLTEILLQTFSYIRYLYYTKRQNEKYITSLNKFWWFKDPEYSWWPIEAKEVESSIFYHPFLSWHPTSKVNTEHINVDEKGIRKTLGNPITIDNDQIMQVFFFGGSSGWGVFLPDDKTIPSFISKEINKEQPKYNIINYSQLGYSNSQELVYLVTLLKQNNIPDYVIFYDGCNDFQSSYLSNGANTLLLEGQIKKSLGKIWDLDDPELIKNKSLFNKDLFSKIKVVYYPTRIYNILVNNKKNNEESINKISDEQLVDTIVNRYTENASFIDTLSKTYKFKYLLIWQPMMFNKVKLSPQEKGIINDIEDFERQKLLYTKVVENLKKKGINNYIDLSDTLNNEETIFMDYCHITSKGNDIIANNIINILNE